MKEIIQFFSRHSILSIVWMGLFSAVLITTVKAFTSKVRLITRAEAIRLINREGAIVADLRHSSDFRMGHIAGAINLVPATIKANKVSELGKDKTKAIIVVDGNGMQAQNSANALIKLGFENIYVLKEGIFGWTAENLPLVRGK